MRFSLLLVDCTGDGLVGFMACARHRISREASHEYGEAWAPEEADGITLGSTLLFYTKDAGHPVRFMPPSFAKDIEQTPIPIKRVIRDELWSVIYGIWDYMEIRGSLRPKA